ncbi:MAG: hypothetical protein SCH98_06180 [Deferrisomatales bacterium]|nr:hypothetical protein [Deferrisomatales bacterium]
MTARPSARGEILALPQRRDRAWEDQDRRGAAGHFAADAALESRTGARVERGEALERARRTWLEGAHVCFEEEETVVDETGHKALHPWNLRRPFRDTGGEGHSEVRRGVDMVPFQGGAVGRKPTRSETSVATGEVRVRLVGRASGSRRGGGR